jgi:hypothetical protein
MTEPEASGSLSTKVIAGLVRDARSLLRRADKLTRQLEALDDPATQELSGEMSGLVDRLVHRLVAVEREQQQRERRAVRRGR